jgi:glycosyltransferase involved in cell wall biosynthesis
MNVILAHDWLTGMRGGERVLESLGREFPGAPILALICNPAAISADITRHPITTTWLQHVPGIARNYRHFLPLFPSAIERLRPPDANVLVSVSHCVAKGIKPQPGTRHLCYCLTPMRYAWLFYEEYFGRNPLKKAILKPMLARLREWDRQTCDRVDRFVTLSRHVQQRIREYYGRDADVVYPPVNTVFWTPGRDQAAQPWPETEPGTYDLIVSALVPYKRIDLAVKAYAQSGAKLILVGTGPESKRLRDLASPNIQFAGWLPDDRIRELYRHCRMVIFPGEEDFGIVPVEAQACGRPVVAFGRGGALETIADNVTGIFFREQTVEALLDAVTRCAKHSWDPAAIRAHSEQFSEDRFRHGMADSIAKCLKP